MNVKLVYAIIVLVILISIQYTLNLILREIKSIRISVMTKEEQIEEYKRR